MTAIDRRIAIRRRTVREAGARRRLRYLLAVIAFFVSVGLIAMLFQSPVMAVSSIEINGSDRADVESVLERHGVELGVPTISVRPADLAADIEDDPWVARAQANITWPGTVAVTVLEHQPIAWLKLSGDWHRIAVDGTILERSEPTKRGARVKIGGLSGEPGDVLDGKRVVAALDFLAMLPAELRRKAVVRAGESGTLRAKVKGHQVDLGNPVDMREKAATLATLLDVGPCEGDISLVSPVRPACRNPQALVES